MRWLLVLIIVLCNTSGDVLNTFGMRRHGRVREFHPSALRRLLAALARNGYVMGGMVAMAISFFALLSLLSIADLSFAIPATSASYLFETILAKCLLSEDVQWQRWLGAGLVACIVGGVWLWGAWAVAAPAFALERVGVFAALGRSVALVKRSFWRVWGIRALGWLLVYILTQLIALPFALLALWLSDVDPLSTTTTAAHAGLYVAVIAVGNLLASAVLAPVASAIDVLLYTDLRMRKEGMDIVLSLPAEATVVTAGPPAVTAW